MIIELLYPELGNLYGDRANAEYLQKSIPNSKLILTPINEEPFFVKHKVDIIIMGTMTEKAQIIILGKLINYKDNIKKLIDKGTIFICTGNSFELFGNRIETEDNIIKCLDLLPTYAKLDMNKRYNSLYLGSFDDVRIVGFKNQFSHSYYIDEKPLFKTNRGQGLNSSTMLEGIRINNFFGTYLLGPLLILNPYFTKYILSLLKLENELAFESDSLEAYKVRLEEFEKESTIY